MIKASLPTEKKKQERNRLESALLICLRISVITLSAMTSNLFFFRAASAFVKRCPVLNPSVKKHLLVGYSSQQHAPNMVQKLAFHTTRNNQNNESNYGGIFKTLLSSSAPKEEIDPGVIEGTNLRIVKYPNPSLRNKNKDFDIPVEEENIKKLAKDMLKVMYAAEGVGLAAPQVGVNKRLIVYNPTGDSKRWLDETVLVNPKIVEFSDATDEETEGCLSFPGMSGDVIRSKWIKVEAFTPRGKRIKKKLKGWEARIFQHEYDHLDGIVYIDKLSDYTKEKIQANLNKLIEEYEGDDGLI